MSKGFKLRVCHFLYSFNFCATTRYLEDVNLFREEKPHSYLGKIISIFLTQTLNANFILKRYILDSNVLWSPHSSELHPYIELSDTIYYEFRTASKLKNFITVLSLLMPLYSNTTIFSRSSTTVLNGTFLQCRNG